VNTLVTKRFKDNKVNNGPFLERPSHSLSLSTARQWVRDDILGEESFFGPSSFNRWQFTLELWVDRRLADGHLTAAALIIELLNAGRVCRVYGTPAMVDQVAHLWVRCHDEAGVACEDCR
jgi:hypothetical protein